MENPERPDAFEYTQSQAIHLEGLISSAFDHDARVEVTVFIGHCEGVAQMIDGAQTVICSPLSSMQFAMAIAAQKLTQLVQTRGHLVWQSGVEVVTEITAVASDHEVAYEGPDSRTALWNVIDVQNLQGRHHTVIATEHVDAHGRPIGPMRGNRFYDANDAPLALLFLLESSVHLVGSAHDAPDGIVSGLIGVIKHQQRAFGDWDDPVDNAFNELTLHLRLEMPPANDQSAHAPTPAPPAEDDVAGPSGAQMAQAKRASEPINLITSSDEH